MKRSRISLEQGLYIAGLLVLGIGGPLLWGYLSLAEKGAFPPCMFQQHFGIYCPGCGGSRAVKALLQGHILQSLYYHPLVLYAAVLYGIFMFSGTISLFSRGRIKALRFHPWFLYGALLLIVLQCIGKNILKFGFGIVVF